MPDFENIDMEAMDKAMSEGTTVTEPTIIPDASYTPPAEPAKEPEATTEPATEPVAEDTPAATEPAAIEPTTTVTAPSKPAEVEKIVEKVVEKYPEFKNDTSKALYEQLINA